MRPVFLLCALVACGGDKDPTDPTGPATGTQTISTLPASGPTTSDTSEPILEVDPAGQLTLEVVLGQPCRP